MNKAQKVENPSTKIIAESSRLSGLGKPNFIKLSPDGSLACMIC